MSSLRLHMVLCFSALILGVSIWSTITIVHFYSHQEEIAAEFCVNKENPELHCKGQCYLQKQLAPKITNQEPITSSRILSTLIIFQSFEALNSIDIHDNFNRAECTTSYVFSICEHFTIPLLNPPEYC